MTRLPTLHELTKEQLIDVIADLLRHELGPQNRISHAIRWIRVKQLQTQADRAFDASQVSFENRNFETSERQFERWDQLTQEATATINLPDHASLEDAIGQPQKKGGGPGAGM